jgi:hypothetical protein
MLCIGLHFGETFRPSLPKVTVRAKLGGKVLGFIDMLPTDLFAKAPLCMVEKLQSQASKLLVHPYRPARYLMVFVGQVCLTGPSFAFTKQLGFELEQACQVASMLLKTKTIDVMYNEDDTYAMQALRTKCKVSKRGHVLEVKQLPTKYVYNNQYSIEQRFKVVLPELEAFGFNDGAGCITCIDFETYGARLCSLKSFKFLEKLCIHARTDVLLKASDFELFAKSQVSSMSLRFTSDKTPRGLGLMTNLTTLDLECSVTKWYFEFEVPRRVRIPAEVGRLRNLKHLKIHGKGFHYDDLPLEITDLQQHGTHVEVYPC